MPWSRSPPASPTRGSACGLAAVRPLARRDAGDLTPVDAILTDPVVQTALADAELDRDSADRTAGAHQGNSASTELGWIRFRHGTNLRSRAPIFRALEVTEPWGRSSRPKWGQSPRPLKGPLFSRLLGPSARASARTDFGPRGARHQPPREPAGLVTGPRPTRPPGDDAARGRRTYVQPGNEPSGLDNFTAHRRLYRRAPRSEETRPDEVNIRPSPRSISDRQRPGDGAVTVSPPSAPSRSEATREVWSASWAEATPRGS
jgi:hypothetical protein